jgi:hypothetical protein
MAANKSSKPVERSRFRFTFPKRFPKLEAVTLSRVLKLNRTGKITIFLAGVAGVIALNVLISPFPFRADFSKNRAYTLSSASQRIIRDTDKKLTITFYVSDTIPRRLQPLKTDISDLLAEYQRVGGDKLKVETVDPTNNEKAREAAAAAGITEIQFSQLEQNNFNVTKGYFGLVLTEGSTPRPIQQLTDLDNLEYNITSAIYAASRTDRPRVAMIGAPQANPFQPGGDQLSVLRQVLSQQFAVEDVNIATPPANPDGTEPTPVAGEEAKIPDGIKTALVFAPAGETFDGNEIAELRSYLNRKGNIIAFAEGVIVDEQALSVRPAEHNLFGLMQEYGITLNGDLVLSSSAELVNFGSQVQQFFVPYPMWFRTNAFATDSPYFTNIPSLTYPWASSLRITEVKDVTVRPIVRTDDRSWRQTKDYVLDPQQIRLPANYEQLVIGADARKKDGGRLVVIPSSRFLLSQFLSRESGNLEFTLNAVNDMASDGALSGIRKRSVDFYPLPALSDTQKDIFKYANMLALPVLFAIGGGIYLMRRRSI